ncbi:GlxA family transcriptional regulator [Hahella sp. HN01]|nr:GlxA family transcriptional regulator [Hahella sp. HN01]
MTGKSMQQVTILGFDYAVSSAITGVVDLLAMAGVTWNHIQRSQPHPKFNIRVATRDAQPVRCHNRLLIQADACFDDIKPSDILVIPSIAGDIEKTLTQNPQLIEVLKTMNGQGTIIAGNCTGAFFMAEAGILDNRTATTHWAFVDMFRQRYPSVDLRPEQMLTASENVFCSGGGIAWLDLCLYLIEHFCGHEVAVQTAKTFVIDMGRTYQSSYSSMRARKYHRDEDVLRVQNWLETHCDQDVRIDDLAGRFNMSPRTLARRFKAATGDTPLGYLQTLRLEEAKKLLEETSDNVSQITLAVGYEDVSSFTKLFRQKTGLTPKEYRNKFQRRSIT